MSTSKTRWQTWLPDDLLVSSAAQDIGEAMQADLPVDFATDAAFQDELSRLRHQAEQRGFAQGMTKGVEEGKKQGYADGFLQGKNEGEVQGKEEGKAQRQQQVEKFAQLLESYQLALDSLESAIPARLVQLALMASRSVLGEHIVCASTNTLLMERIKQLLREDILLKGKAKLWVSADDAASVQQLLGETLDAHGWVLCTDAQLLPGGCRITTDEGEVDATLETRWQMLCDLGRSERSA